MIKKILIFLSSLALIDSLYLSSVQLFNKEVACFINDINSCSLVLNSSYSHFFFGIPNSVLGILFFSFLIFSFYFWEKLKNKFNWYPNLILTILILTDIFYIYLIYLQKYILSEYCYYCLFSALLTFIISFIFWKSFYKK